MGKILVIDDSSFMRGFLRSALEEAGHEVADLLPLSGLEVAQRVQAWGPDVVLTDYHMPHVKGDVVVRMAKKGYPAVRILVLTSSRDPALAGALERLGAERILYKPMQGADIVKAVVAILP